MGIGEHADQLPRFHLKVFLAGHIGIHLLLFDCFHQGCSPLAGALDYLGRVLVDG